MDQSLEYVFDYYHKGGFRCEADRIIRDVKSIYSMVDKLFGENAKIYRKSNQITIEYKDGSIEKFGDLERLRSVKSNKTHVIKKLSVYIYIEVSDYYLRLYYTYAKGLSLFSQKFSISTSSDIVFNLVKQQLLTVIHENYYDPWYNILYRSLIWLNSIIIFFFGFVLVLEVVLADSDYLHFSERFKLPSLSILLDWPAVVVFVWLQWTIFIWAPKSLRFCEQFYFDSSKTRIDAIENWIALLFFSIPVAAIVGWIVNIIS